MKLAHFILTRYAMRIVSDAVMMRRPELRMTDADGLPSAEWLTSRRELFEAYALPSVCAQTVQDFTWLVFYDIGLARPPKWLHHSLNRWALRCRQLVPVSSDEPWDNCNETMRDAIRAHLPEGTTHVITTRLDNDDMIAPDFLAFVRSAFDTQPVRTFVNVHDGENWNTLTGERRENHHPHNMFLSVIEPVADVQGVYTWAHNSVPSLGYPMVNLHGGPPRWTHVLHDWNLWPAGRRA